MIFDTHAHYDDKAFEEDRDAVLASLRGAGVGRVIDVGASVRSLKRIPELAAQYDFLYGALGLHPDEVGQLTDEVREQITRGLKNPKMVAVGEIGLDYHWDVEPHEVQIRCFKEQIRIALQAEKPIIVHSRSAAEDTMSVIEELYGAGSPAKKVAKQEALKKLQPDSYVEVPGKEWVWKKEIPEGPGHHVKRKGIIHAYAYSAEHARIYTGLGFFLGIGGVLTYQNSRKLKKVVKEIPLEYLVLETDCPYLAPEPHRGERNSSAYLPEVVKAIAAIKEVPEAEVEAVTWENACRLFDLPE